jgi:hypothetical protein
LATPVPSGAASSTPSQGEQAALEVLNELGVPPPATQPPAYIEQYQQWQLRFNKRSYEWHLISTVLIFAMVMGIVLFGLYLTWLQFTREQHRAHRASARAAAAPASESEGEAPAPAPEPAASSLKISATGVEVTSQVIGLLILGFSLAFFYLYVKEVYPMQIAASKAPDKEKASSP